MKIEFSRFVESDLDMIADYIALDNPRRAITFLHEIHDKLRQLARRPMLYQLRPEIGEGARLATAGDYVILFRIVAKVVRVERVVYGGRNLPSLFQ